MLLMFLASATLTLSGCGQGCTDIGCDDGDGYAWFDLRAQTDTWPAEQELTYVFSLRFDGIDHVCAGSAASGFDCDSDVMNVVIATVGVGDAAWSSVEALSLTVFPPEVVLTVERRGEQVLEQSFEVHERVTYPNGEQCGSGCRGWTEVVRGWPLPCLTEPGPGATYELCASPETWEGARAHCAASGARLVSIEDAAEDDWLDARVDAISQGPWWTGGTDLDVEGSWVWDGAGPLDYTHWGPSEPNDWGGVEHCLHLNFYDDGAWDDSDCSNLHPFVCERPD
ncbi:MAG: hypothetical protein ACI8PZ_006875 [Myxococcota bacterium]|jgi:hypothetical protein